MSHASDVEQLSALNETIVTAKKSPLYSVKLKDVDRLSSLSEILSLPFTTKAELREIYPYGGLCVDPKHIIEMHTSSGTTGVPTLSFYTKEDIELGSQAIAQAWACFGINDQSIVQFIMGYGLFSGAMLNTYAIQKLGAFVIPAGIQSVAKQVDFMIAFGVDTLVATPGFLLYLCEFINLNNIDRSKIKLKRAIAAGEVYSELVRNKIEAGLNIKVHDHYGLCEVNTGIAYECEHRQGLHLLDNYIIAEIVNPKTGEILPEGEFGELVLTSLKKTASPIIRYRTGDVSYLLNNTCACGITGPRIGRITSRVDDMLFIRGLKINPHELKTYIFEILGDNIFGGDIQIKVKENTIKDDPIIFISFKNYSEKMAEELKQKLHEKIGVRFDIVNVDKTYFDREKNNKVKLIIHE